MTKVSCVRVSFALITSAIDDQFTKAHAYGNDFLYVRKDASRRSARRSAGSTSCRARARDVRPSHRHRRRRPDRLRADLRTGRRCVCSMPTAAAQKCPATVSAASAAILLRARRGTGPTSTVTIHTEAGAKRLTRLRAERVDTGHAQTFRAAMGLPRDLRQTRITAGGETLRIAVMDFGNPQAVLLGPLPDRERFARLGSALEHHQMFPAGHEHRVRAGRRPGVGPHSDLGAGRRADALVGDRFVRGPGRRRGLRRRQPRRRGHRARRGAARRVARRQRLPDRMGGDPLRRRVAAAPRHRSEGA